MLLYGNQKKAGMRDTVAKLPSHTRRFREAYCPRALLRWVHVYQKTPIGATIQ
jgi:hypothetical protein